MEYWKYKAIDKLKDYSLKKTALVNLPEEIRRLEIDAQRIKSATADGTPVKGGGSGREERLISNIVEREEHKAKLSIAKITVEMVDRGLAVLDPDERHILDTMYIYRTKGSVSRLMEEYNLVEESSLYKKVNKALLRFTMAMYGVTEY